MTLVSTTAHIPSVENGADAVSYEIVPSTLVVSLDENGNWVEGTETLNDFALVKLKAVKITGGKRSDYYGCWDGDGAIIPNTVYTAPISKNDFTKTYSLYETKYNSQGKVIKGELLSVITITVNRAGKNGDSLTVKSTTVYYGISASGTDSSSVTDWQQSILNTTVDKPYLWSKTDVEFSDGKHAITYSATTRGNKGATFRQHAVFEPVGNNGYNYQSGSGVEEFIDTIPNANGSVWYRCVLSYNSKEHPEYDSLTSKAWSSSGAQQRFIATDFLLAQNATIKMLGTNEINLYSSDNKMFGSFRVPSGNASVNGDRDGGEYALWLGSGIGENAPFSVTDKGALRSTSGTIGGFRIGQDHIGSTQDYNMYLTNERLHFGSWVGLSNNNGYALDINGGGYRGISIMSITGDASKISTGIFSSVIANSNVGNYCAAAELQAAWATSAGDIDMTDALSGNHAILIHSGDVAGMRQSFVRLKNNKTLTDYNHTIECYNAADIYLTLPSEPKYGQHYEVIQRGNTVNFKGGKYNIRDMNSNSVDKNWYTGTVGQVSYFWFNGNEWLVRYIN